MNTAHANTPDTMRAFELGSEEEERWRPVERNVPQPGPGQVLIRVHAVSLNYRDVLIARRRYGASKPPPHRVPTSDGAGVVVARGKGSNRWAIGERVASTFSQSWIDGPRTDAAWRTTLGDMLDGMLAEYVLLDEMGLVRLPEHLSFAEGATLPVAAVTAWNALHGLRPLRSGAQVLAIGTGGVSIFALQLANAAGADVIITSSSDEKLQHARELGARHTINYRSCEQWQEEVLRLSNGRGVDHVIETGGAGTLPQSLACVRPDGVVSLIGVLAEGSAVDPRLVLRSNAVLRGITVGSRAQFEQLNAVLALHRIAPCIDRTFPFASAPEALQYLASGQHFGKVVVQVA